MISRDEFDTLTSLEKFRTVFESGEVLDQREINEFRIRLYLVGDFYVELWHKGKSPKITSLISLSPEEVLDFYGDNIDISDVFTF